MLRKDKVLHCMSGFRGLPLRLRTHPCWPFLAVQQVPVSRWCASGSSRVALLSSNSLLASSSMATIHRCLSTVSVQRERDKHDSTHEVTRMTKFHRVADGSEVGAAKMLMRSTGPEAMSQSLRHLLHTTWHYTSSLLSILCKEGSVSEQAVRLVFRHFAPPEFPLICPAQACIAVFPPVNTYALTQTTRKITVFIGTTWSSMDKKKRSKNGHFSDTFAGICRRFRPKALFQTPKNAFLGPRSHSKGPNHALEKVLTSETPRMSASWFLVSPYLI